MINLVIDAGNTRTKVALFCSRSLVKVDSYESLQPYHLQNYLQNEKITHSILSSVRSDDLRELEELLKAHTRYIRFSANSATTITNLYKNPVSLGLDRLAGIIGAQALYPEQNCLVIDAGTCITYDIITQTGVYPGGSISPGLHMRLKALHALTDRLPLVDFDTAFEDLLGIDTTSSILSGVLHGTLFEMQGFIEKYAYQYPQLQVVLCGGDAIFFDSRLKNTIFAPVLSVEPHLVLAGLNEIIHQQND